MKKKIFFLVSILIILSGNSFAQAGHPKDSIMFTINKCTDCTALTWTTENDFSILTYKIVPSGIVHQFYFDKKNICVKYIELYPNPLYLQQVSDYMDKNYVKLSNNHWKQFLFTTKHDLVIDRYGDWVLSVYMDGTFEVIEELKPLVLPAPVILTAPK